LINDVLDFSKIEAGQLELERIEFDLHELVETAATIFGIRAQTKGLELLCYVDPLMPLRLIGDPTRIRQVLVNLIGNAIKFTNYGEVLICVEPGNHSARVRQNEVEVCFSVSDTGIGITGENVHKIFEKFSQADSSTTRRFGGTGLGLSISKSLVEKMGGVMTVDSAAGKGSTFRFRLALPVAESAPAGLPLGLNGRRVVIVAAHPTNRRTIRQTLAAVGLHTYEVANGSEALSILMRADSTDAVIFDHDLPDMDGYELTRRIKEMRPNPGLKLLMIAAIGGMDSAASKKLGIDVSVTKPIQPYRLIEILDNLFGGHETAIPDQKIGGAPDENGRPQKVLVVEDNPDNQRLARKMLESAGYVVELADNGMSAVNAATTKDFDLIMMDIQMPVKDGFEATREIRGWEQAQGKTRVPIIALTAHAIAGYRDQCLAHGMDDYVTKPFRKQALLAKLEKWLMETAPDSTR